MFSEQVFCIEVTFLFIWDKIYFMRLRINTKLIHWIAVFSILMSALAPTISQAIALKSPSKSFVSEICSVAGLKQIHVVSTDDQSTDASFAQAHCPYCAIQAIFLPALNNDLHFAFRQSHQLILQHDDPFSKPLFSWLKLPSQAPPSFFK